MHITDPVRNAMVDAVRPLFAAGILEFRTGSKPATSNLAPTGTVVAAITLPNPAWAAAAAGVASLSGTWSDASADNAGTIGHARFRQTGDLGTTNSTDERMDLTVSTVAAGTGEIQIDNTTLVAGQALSITAHTLTQPAGA